MMPSYAKVAILTALLVALVAIGVWSNRSARAAAPLNLAVAPTSTSVSSPTPTPGIPSNPDPGSRAPDLPSLPPGKLQGRPGIQPSLQNPAPGTPAFTEQDVRAQIMAPGLWAGQFQPSGAITVTSVEFLTVQQVGVRINQPLPPTTSNLLCLVKLTGSFSRYAPEPGGAFVSTHLFLAFDGQTGNLILTYQPAGAADK